MYCRNCGTELKDGALFCGTCGTPVKHVSEQIDEQHDNDRKQARNQQGGTNHSTWFDHLNDYVGNDQPAMLNWKMLFSDVTKKHVAEEAEEIFICGTRKTTPAVNEVSKDWPHPWLYSRVFLLFLVAFVLLWICCAAFNNINALPGLIVVGSFTVPLSTMVLFMEVNAWRNISFYEVIKIFLVGGCASLVATLFLFSFISVEELDFFGAIITGVIEEVGKAAIVYLFLKRLKTVNILSAMLVGACVGAGFAAFESAGYALRFFLQGGWDLMMNVIFLRGFLTPGGHVTWAAITGAALAIAAKNGNRGITPNLLTSAQFLRLFAIPVALHATWDSPLSNIGSALPLVPIGLSVFAWVVVLILVNMGLTEVSRKQSNI